MKPLSLRFRTLPLTASAFFGLARLSLLGCGAATLDEMNTSGCRATSARSPWSDQGDMMRIDDTTSQKLTAAVAQTLTPLVEQLHALNEALNHSMQEYWASANGRALRAWLQHNDQQPRELDAVLVSCDCLCRRWGHLGTCTGWATAERDAGPPHNVVLQVCGPCAVGIDAHRRTAAAR